MLFLLTTVAHRFALCGALFLTLKLSEFFMKAAVGRFPAPAGYLSCCPKSPSGAAGKVITKVLAAVFEFVADQSDSVQIGAHRELFILGLVFPAARTLLGQSLIVQRQGKDNIAANFSGMKFAVKAAKFNRMITSEKAMQI